MDRNFLIGIEIVTRRKYAVHARNEEAALEMIQSFEQNQNPTTINGISCGGAYATALNRTQSSIEKIPLDGKDSPDETVAFDWSLAKFVDGPAQEPRVVCVDLAEAAGYHTGAGSLLPPSMWDPAKELFEYFQGLAPEEQLAFRKLILNTGEP